MVEVVVGDGHVVHGIKSWTQRSQALRKPPHLNQSRQGQQGEQGEQREHAMRCAMRHVHIRIMMGDDDNG